MSVSTNSQQRFSFSYKLFLLLFQIFKQKRKLDTMWNIFIFRIKILRVSKISLKLIFIMIFSPQSWNMRILHWLEWTFASIEATWPCKKEHSGKVMTRMTSCRRMKLIKTHYKRKKRISGVETMAGHCFVLTLTSSSSSLTLWVCNWIIKFALNSTYRSLIAN